MGYRKRTITGTLEYASIIYKNEKTKHEKVAGRYNPGEVAIKRLSELQ